MATTHTETVAPFEQKTCRKALVQALASAAEQGVMFHPHNSFFAFDRSTYARILGFVRTIEDESFADFPELKEHKLMGYSVVLSEIPGARFVVNP